jgi:hypothetical protein
MHTPDVFYRTAHLGLKAKKQLLRDAGDKSISWWVDILDCKISWARQKTNMPFPEILVKLTQKCHFVFIIRNMPAYEQNQFLEIGFCTLAQKPEYFLFIHCEIEHLNYFVDKYKLEIVKSRVTT